MKNKGRRGAGERKLPDRKRESSFSTPSSLCSDSRALFTYACLLSYLLELEELLLDLEPLGRRLVGLAPDELEHLVAAAADGPLGRLHHVGRGHDADDRGGDVAGPVCLSSRRTAPHCSTHAQRALARLNRSRKSDEREGLS